MAGTKEIKAHINSVRETKKITNAMYLIASTKLRRARLELAQYREMEVFTQFSSDLDEATKRQLAYGQGLMRLLRQPQYAPLSQHQQVALLTAALNRVMQDVPLEQMEAFRTGLLAYVEKASPDLCRRIDMAGLLTPEDREEILDLSRKFLTGFREGGKRGA